MARQRRTWVNPAPAHERHYHVDAVGRLDLGPYLAPDSGLAGALVRRMAASPSIRRRSMPIGRPIAGAEIRILHASVEPAPIGVSGELYFGGVPLGRGCLGRPGLHGAALRARSVSSARLYRTGDLVRGCPTRPGSFAATPRTRLHPAASSSPSMTC